MESTLEEIACSMAGMTCLQKEVGRMKSLSLGFGQLLPSTSQSNIAQHREWEIGTYRSAWRVVQGKNVLCGSQDVVDSIEELSLALQKIDLGRFLRFGPIGHFDVRIDFENDIAVDFLAASSDDDELFHIFCSDRRYLEFSIRGGWRIGSADEPWDRSTAWESGVK